MISPIILCGSMQMRDGSLLISDGGGRKIWRVTYSGNGKG